MSGFNITDEDDNNFSFHYNPLRESLKFNASITDGYGKVTNHFDFININQLRLLISYLQGVERNWKDKE